MSDSQFCPPYWIAVLGLLVFGSAAAAQPAEPSAPEPDAAPGSDQPKMSIAEALAKAAQEIQVAEERGPEAANALEKAARHAGYVLSNDPINARAGFILGRVLLLRGRPREALGHLKKYITAREGESDWLGFKLVADIYLDGKYYSMARTKYLKALELSPNERDVYVGLARTELRMKMHEEAAEHARRAVELNQGEDPVPEPHAVLAQALLALKRFDEAEAAAARASDLSRAHVYNHPGDVRRLAELDAMLALEGGILEVRQNAYPEQPEVYLRIARVIQERADVARLRAYHKSLNTLLLGVSSTEPNTPVDLLYEAARLQYTVGQNDEALETLQKLFEQDPDHPAATKLREKIEAEIPSRDRQEAPGTEPRPSGSGRN